MIQLKNLKILAIFADAKENKFNFSYFVRRQYVCSLINNLYLYHIYLYQMRLIIKSFSIKDTRKRRQNFPKEVTEVLKKWVEDHRYDCYPTEEEKDDLALETGLTLLQVIIPLKFYLILAGINSSFLKFYVWKYSCSSRYEG